MLGNPEIRRIAREKLSKNWVPPIVVCVIYSFIYSAASGLVLIIGGPFRLGLSTFFLKLIRDEDADFDDLFGGFNDFASSFLLFVLVGIFTFLWSLLFVIPGIIAALRYALAFYIMRDNPGIKAMDAIEKSKQLMAGYKGQLFMLGLSFIGWSLLALLTCCIGFLWLVPYMEASFAAFYQERLRESGELPVTEVSGTIENTPGS